MPGVLLTGFGPFPGAPVNPTSSIIEQAARPDGWRTLLLQTEYQAVAAALDGAAASGPDVVILTGLAAGAERVRIELIARNAVAPGRPDASGACWEAGVIEAGASDQLAASADLPALFSALNEAGADFEISRDAGGYVCNFAYFLALRRWPEARIAFVHTPMTERAFAAQDRSARGGSAHAAGPLRQRLLPEAEAVRAVRAIAASQL